MKYKFSDLKPVHLKATVKKLIHDLLHINAEPKKIAGGFAVGVFIGLFPTFGIGFFIAAFFSWAFKINLPSAIIGNVLFGNPLISPICLSASIATGKLIERLFFDINVNVAKNIPWLNKILNFSVEYIIGNLILSVLFSFVFYYVVLFSVKKFKKH